MERVVIIPEEQRATTVLHPGAERADNNIWKIAPILVCGWGELRVGNNHEPVAEGPDPAVQVRAPPRPPC